MPSLRLFCLLLLVLLPWLGWGADLISPVPAGAPAYGQLRELDHSGLLAPIHSSLLADVPKRLLARYDVALLLIEPLERLIALVQAQENQALSPEQSRRRDLAYSRISTLPAREFDHLLSSITQLARGYGAEVDALNPGILPTAKDALTKLNKAPYRPWLALPPPATTTELPTWRVTLAPHREPDPIGNPLPVLPDHLPGTELLPRALRTLPAPPNGSAMAILPITSFEAALDVALGRFRLYGTLGTLPGQYPSELLKLDGTGRASLGVKVDLVRVSAVGISGLFEYHVQRSGEEGNLDTSSGAVGGVGLSW
jgi:hypothetical protein